MTTTTRWSCRICFNATSTQHHTHQCQANHPPGHHHSHQAGHQVSGILQFHRRAIILSLHLCSRNKCRKRRDKGKCGKDHRNDGNDKSRGSNGKGKYGKKAIGKDQTKASTEIAIARFCFRTETKLLDVGGKCDVHTCGNRFQLLLHYFLLKCLCEIFSPHSLLQYKKPHTLKATSHYTSSAVLCDVYRCIICL